MVLNVWDMIPAVAPGGCSAVTAVTLKDKQVLEKEMFKQEYLELQSVRDLILSSEIALKTLLRLR